MHLEMAVDGMPINIRPSFIEESNWLKNRIKSLRPQPHWKPSEEQMEALMTAMAIVGVDEYKQVAETLFLLHEQLKKL